MEQSEENKSCTLTVGEVTFVTTGNILFAENQEYFIAESAVLQRFDALVQDGILSNGMKFLMNKIKAKVAQTSEE